MDTERDVICTSTVPTGQIDRRGDERKPFSCLLVSYRDPARFRSAEGLEQWPPQAMRLANQVKAVEIWPDAVLWFALDVV